MEGFSSALGSQGKLSSRRRRRRRQALVRRPTPDHPEMAALDGRQVEGLDGELQREFQRTEQKQRIGLLGLCRWSSST